MTLENTAIADLFILTPSVFSDERGYFFEAYNELTLEALGIQITFV